MNQLPSTAVNSQENLDQMPIMNHLVVLRRHLFRIVGVTLFLFFVYCPFEIILINYYLSL